MKKLLFIFIALVFSAGMLVAQAQVFFGARAGINFSKIKFSSGFNNEYIQIYRFNAANKKLLGYNSLNGLGFQAGARLGVRLGDRFELLTEPSFNKRNISYRTNDVVKEPIEGMLDINNSTYDLDYTSIKPGIRTWDLSFNSISIPVMARLKVFGDRFGMNLMTGLAFNINFSGNYATTFRSQEGETQNTGGNPKWFSNLTDPALDGDFKPVSNEYVVASGSKLTFGTTQLEQFNNFYASVLLSPGFYYNLDDDGEIRLTLDWQWDFGLRNLYSTNRTKFLRNKDLFVVNSDDPTRAKIEKLEINGTQKMRSGILSIGVEICPSCGF